MASSYPTSVKVFTSKADSVDFPQAAHINDLQDEVNAVESEILSSGLTLTSGKIKFPATQVPSAGANDLDDYEEGTFTPVLKFGGNTTGITYSTQSGKYTKIGNQVTVEIRIVLTSKGSATGAATVTGLPFTAANLPTFAVDPVTGFTGLTGVLLGGVSTTTVSLVQTSATGRTAIDDTNFTATTEFRVSGVYLT